jgi:penicillin amidase
VAARSWGRRVLLGLCGLLALALIAAYLAVRGSLPRLEGQWQGPGLSAPVSVERDSLGVVTITGESRADVAWATGFVHAQDRYFQMDLARRMAAGRLAELVGDAALEVDRGHRVHRFGALAGRVLARLPPAQRQVLEAYAAGVNAGLDDLAVRPFEYLLLRRRPEPWSAGDSLLVVYAMYLQLHDSRADADRQRGFLRAALPPDVFRFVHAFAPEWEAPLDGLVAAAPPLPAPSSYDLQRFASAYRAPAVASLRTSFEQRAPGSNNWAVGGAHTASGAGLLANDMHLGLGVPNTWYRARLRVRAGAPIELAGVTLPGAPILVVGSNGRVAWGFTNSYGDWSDLVTVELSPDGSRYRGVAGWRPLERHVETLRSSSGRRETFDVPWTEWGPLLERTPGQPALALRWTAQEPQATNLDWLGLETVADVESALALANSIGGPAQNFVAADAQGNVGWTLLGRMPLRGPACDAGVPSEATGPGAGWQGWRDPGDYPRIVNPPSGRIWSANNRVVGGEALAAIGDGSPDRGARAQQIRDALFALGAASERDMLAIQLDDRALFLTRWRDLLLDEIDAAAVQDEPARAEFRRHLEEWDARASAGSVGYFLVRSFHERVSRKVFDALTIPVRGAGAPEELVVPPQFEEAAWRLLQERPVHLLDPRYGDWDGFLLATVDETMAEVRERCDGPIAACTWGARNAVRIRHPLSGAIPLLGRWLDMPVVPMGGDNDMPHVHVTGFGASERFAVSPGRERDGYFHMPGGQSGHPLSPYYRAGHEAWVRGEPTPFLPGTTRHTLQLRP